MDDQLTSKHEYPGSTHLPLPLPLHPPSPPPPMPILIESSYVCSEHFRSGYFDCKTCYKYKWDCKFEECKAQNRTNRLYGLKLCRMCNQTAV